MRTIILSLLTLVVMSSCNSTRIYQDASHAKLTNDNLSDLDGMYSHGLWDKLKPTKAKADEKCLVRLTVINKHKIRTELVRDNAVISSATLKGKLRKNGYYSINPCINLVPIPVYFVFTRHKQDITVTDKKDLHVAYSRYGISVVMLLAGTHESRGEAVYERRQ